MSYLTSISSIGLCLDYTENRDTQLYVCICHYNPFSALQFRPPIGERRHHGGSSGRLFTSSRPPVGLWSKRGLAQWRPGSTSHLVALGGQPSLFHWKRQSGSIKLAIGGQTPIVKVKNHEAQRRIRGGPPSSPPVCHSAAERQLASTRWLASGGPLEGHLCYVYTGGCT